MNREEAWSEDQFQDTLAALRGDYPNYTDNELYAIWCRDQDLIPVDPMDGKVLIDQWQIHAAHDGRHIGEEGFKVSRPLYGRALKAEKGMAKASYKRRTKKEMEGETDSGGGRFGGVSEQGMALALRFDEAKRQLDASREAFRQLEMLRMRLVEFSPAILAELARSDMEAQELLKQLGLLD
ncbi:MAG: hypothetical protein ACYTEP_12605 [Planctomycetota bacterium]|jgi:hypothetical protein